MQYTISSPHNAFSRFLQPASTALNRKAAASGVVLLRNKAVGTAPLLPLDLSRYVGKMGSILVAGATADNGNNTLGNYACNAGNCSSNVTGVLGGLRNAQTGLHTKGNVLYSPGCTSTNCSDPGTVYAICSTILCMLYCSTIRIILPSRTPPILVDGSSFSTAAAAAKKAMVTVVVLGTLG
jgi:hypothetical protein